MEPDKDKHLNVKDISSDLNNNSDVQPYDDYRAQERKRQDQEGIERPQSMEEVVTVDVHCHQKRESARNSMTKKAEH